MRPCVQVSVNVLLLDVWPRERWKGVCVCVVCALDVFKDDIHLVRYLLWNSGWCFLSHETRLSCEIVNGRHYVNTHIPSENKSPIFFFLLESIMFSTTRNIVDHGQLRHMAFDVCLNLLSKYNGKPLEAKWRELERSSSDGGASRPFDSMALTDNMHLSIRATSTPVANAHNNFYLLTFRIMFAVLRSLLLLHVKRMDEWEAIWAHEIRRKRTIFVHRVCLEGMKRTKTIQFRNKYARIHAATQHTHCTHWFEFSFSIHVRVFSFNDFNDTRLRPDRERYVERNLYFWAPNTDCFVHFFFLSFVLRSAVLCIVLAAAGF